jgi:hypothetical protein
MWRTGPVFDFNRNRIYRFFDFNSIGFEFLSALDAIFMLILIHMGFEALTRLVHNCCKIIVINIRPLLLSRCENPHFSGLGPFHHITITCGVWNPLLSNCSQSTIFDEIFLKFRLSWPFCLHTVHLNREQVRIIPFIINISSFDARFHLIRHFGLRVSLWRMRYSFILCIF